MTQPPIMERPNRLPNRPPKPYISPGKKGNKAMTIGIGFLTGDAVIMGADRQMTLPGSHKYPDSKLFQDATDERIIVFVGGDDLNLATEVWWKLLEYPISNYNSYQLALETILNEMGRTLTDLPLQALCGIATKNNTGLFEFRGRGIRPVHNFGVICAGDSPLIRYFSKHTDFFWLSCNEGVVAATYILKRAEEFLSEVIHGPIDIIALQPGPKIDTFDPAVIEELDKRLAQNHGKAFRELLSLSPPFSI